MSGERHDNLGLIRFVAASAIIYGHAFALNLELSPSFLSNSVQAVGLKLFALLSGFLIAQSWDSDGNLLRFGARRLLRLFPGLALALLISALLLGPAFTSLPLGEYFQNPRVWRYLGNVGLNITYDLPGVFAQNPYPHAVNGALWSLPVLGCLYLLALPLLAFAAASKRPRAVLGIAAAATLAASTLLVHSGGKPLSAVGYGIALTSLLDMAPAFFMGALWFACGWHRRVSAQGALLALLVCMMFPSTHPAVDEVVLTLLLPLVVLGLGFAADPILARYGKLGDLSYGLFLYGFPVQQALSALHGKPMIPHLGAALTFVLSLGLALLSWHLVEKRLLWLRPQTRRGPPPFGSITAVEGPPVPGSTRQQLEAGALLLLLNFGLGLPGLLYRERRWPSFLLGCLQLSLEVLLLGLLVLLSPARLKGLAATVGGLLYAGLIIFLGYHFVFAWSFQRVPAIAEDLPLALNLFHFLQDLLGPAIWLLGLGLLGAAALIVGGVRRVLLRLEAAASSNRPRWRVVLGVMLIVGVGIAFLRAGERVQFRSRTIASNLATSRERAEKLREAVSHGPDTRYRPFGQLRLERRPNVYLMMIEAYGQRLSADPEMKEPFRVLLSRMETRLADKGFQVRSGLSEAPVFGGRSWLSIATVQTGIKVDQPGVFSLLGPVAMQIPSLTGFFKQQGYVTYAMQPGNVSRIGLGRGDLFERDVVLDGPDLQYRGTPYGWVRTPDQYSLGLFGQRLAGDQRPRLAFFMSVSTHHPWLAVPFAKDWQTLNTPERVEVAEWPPIPGVEAITEGFPRQYFQSVTYDWRALADFIELEAAPDAIFILVGDHQPLIARGDPEVIDEAVAAAANAESSNTFVHVISRDQALVEQFAQVGFTPGLFVEPGPAALKHEGLFSLIVTQLFQRHGAPTSEPPRYYPDGIGLSGLLP